MLAHINEQLEYSSAIPVFNSVLNQLPFLRLKLMCLELLLFGLNWSKCVTKFWNGEFFGNAGGNAPT